MKHFRLFALGMLALCIPAVFQQCAKKNPECGVLSATGRIIGYDPCNYFTPTNKRINPGFVLEVISSNSIDTMVSYSLPTNLFSFPEIEDRVAALGVFLYPKDLQDKFKIRFNYDIVQESKKTAVLCRGDIYVYAFEAAVKKGEINLSCISKY